MQPISEEFLALGIEGLYYVLLLMFTIYGVFLAYHWFAFGTSKKTSLLALALYLIGGAILFITLSLALRMIS
jgi:hypothetical protein